MMEELRITEIRTLNLFSDIWKRPKKIPTVITKALREVLVAHEKVYEASQCYTK